MSKTGAQIEIGLGNKGESAQSPAEFIPVTEIAEAMNHKPNPNQAEFNFGNGGKDSGTEKLAIDLAEAKDRKFFYWSISPAKNY
ncbi:hypothetical protein A3H55_02725 [Candidatus Kuenenbacteria bacterium RIFCSPLOWO2_02_FULL_42_16]|uniref:Uncharacterized protein n=1 Tax=Candidatus Kuenenbacteria bacterium RIFCSPLOWO2_02_FULL_42_16 TaxID=1798564 RepID=A0A1F6G0Z4_9BACT|nr:MAG: hypothetical protein A3H55_02725 [Candidatus Kuenenbacteria bacterium RIFCSPLOWO2_02_FULL_42_16]